MPAGAALVDNISAGGIRRNVAIRRAVGLWPHQVFGSETMRSLPTLTILTIVFGTAAAAQAQPYYYSRPFPIAPATPETMPTVSPYGGLLGPLSGTSKPTITATPECGAANPQHGIPSPFTGNCPGSGG